jgi:hypothetical protein
VQNTRTAHTDIISDNKQTVFLFSSNIADEHEVELGVVPEDKAEVLDGAKSAVDVGRRNSLSTLSLAPTQRRHTLPSQTMFRVCMSVALQACKYRLIQ